ncbi:hypothetical protein C0993_011831, partial [Termitomyces sp. T159_Od127]
MGTLPCFKCMAMKRFCTLDGTKTHKWGNTPNPMVERTYHWAVLVRRAWEVMEKAREEREGSKGKQKASLPLLPTDKGKKRARVVSPMVVTSKVKSKDEEEDSEEACCLAAAIEASKVCWKEMTWWIQVASQRCLKMLALSKKTVGRKMKGTRQTKGMRCRQPAKNSYGERGCLSESDCQHEVLSTQLPGTCHLAMKWSHGSLGDGYRQG